MPIQLVHSMYGIYVWNSDTTNGWVFNSWYKNKCFSEMCQDRQEGLHRIGYFLIAQGFFDDLFEM